MAERPPVENSEQREMTKFCVFWRTRKATAYFLYFYLEFYTGITHLDRVNLL